MKIRAVVKLPHMKAEVTEIENDLEALQRLVGGNIETVTWTDDMCIICNEEWRLLKLEKNMPFLGMWFGGPVIFVGVKGDEFDSLSETNAKLVLSMIRNK